MCHIEGEISSSASKGYGIVTELMHVAAVASPLVETAESESGIKALPNKAISTANRLTVRHK